MGGRGEGRKMEGEESSLYLGGRWVLGGLCNFTTGVGP